MSREYFRLDKQCNGGQADGDDLLEDPALILNYRNIANTGRFQTLYDKTFNWNTTAGVGGGPNSARITKQYLVKINKKVYIPIEFSSTTGGITEIKSNNIGLLVWSKEGRVEVEAASQLRIRFIDY